MSRAQKGLGDGWDFLSSAKALEEIGKLLKKDLSLNVILTGQYTNEEYEELKGFFTEGSFYHWEPSAGKEKSFDGLLLRGDRNPNTAGMKKVFPEIKPLNQLQQDALKGSMVFVAGPENQNFFSDLEEKTRLFSAGKTVVWMASCPNPFLPPGRGAWQIPVKSFFEKSGTFQNAKGVKQRISAIQPIIPEALSLEEAVQILKGEPVKKQPFRPYFKHNQFLNRKERLW